jgi:hypothetical protein
MRLADLAIYSKIQASIVATKVLTFKCLQPFNALPLNSEAIKKDV